MRLYGFGQIIDSDLDIAGTIRTLDDAAADIVVRHHPPASPIEAPLYTVEGDELVFTAPQVGSYRCRADAIDVVPNPGVDAEAIASLLIATALPTVLWLQGRFVLHASAVRLPGCDKAIAFAGPSGVGKSTIAAALVARGADLLADDSMALSEALLANGLPGGMFETVEILAESGDEVAIRRFVPLPVERTVRGASLAALFILSRGDEPCTRLPPLAAFQQFLRQRHRPSVPAVLGRLGEGLTTCSMLSTRLPVYLWPRRQGRAALEDAEQEMLGAATRGDLDWFRNRG